ncbi:hypothetical protein A2U01_0078802 [Trifolium medium]|uniref:Uncharacterized protein n=1 Tax=Trifolium medium TaxID=97028 RepID=A0A392T8Y8_9FABA|nr:hypothetical protein [Trifolium medium]
MRSLAAVLCVERFWNNLNIVKVRRFVLLDYSDDSTASMGS